MKITIEYPEYCTEQEAITYASACFNPKQHDYKRLNVGFRQGVGFSYRDDRYAYCYRTMKGDYVLRIDKR